ncbi:chemotaxis protein CheW [Thermodesulfobacteriota bacterium]
MENMTGKYLTFSLGKEEYGLPIQRVKEIIGMMEITKVPQTPGFVKGVINLRGKVIPVIDLRSKFLMQACDETERTCIVVVEFHRESSLILVGMVVDTVSEVLNIKSDNIEGSSQLGLQLSSEYLLGMAKTDNGVKMLLNMDSIIGGSDIDSIDKAA